MREKIALQREKRRIKEKLKKVKTLGESDSDEESASSWVKKSRILEKEKAAAEKRVIFFCTFSHLKTLTYIRFNTKHFQCCDYASDDKSLNDCDSGSSFHCLIV